MFQFRIKKITTLIFLFLLTYTIVDAQSVDQIKQNIDGHNDRIKQLDAEIKVYEKQIEVVGGEAKTLQNAIKVLDINQQKIGTEIKKTETNIQKTNLSINNLGSEIDNIQDKIESNVMAIAKILKDMQQRDDETLIESLLTNKSLAEVLDEYESISQFQQKVRVQSKELEMYKNELTGKKTLTEAEKNKLLNFKSELSDQNYSLDINKKEKSNLLTTTKNKEAEYKKMLADRQAEKERFEKELFLYESQLKKAINPDSFPSSSKGILSWPLGTIRITQQFGRTIDSKRLYSSGTHNGVDFGVSVGTPVLASLNGVVTGSGNTDEQRGCYSYGKWILIKHPNGLSTMYAHLSGIKVSAGQEVKTGEIIGYSGNTGYSTGPHLHLTVYATEGLVGIQKYSSSINCKNVSIPIADVKAYLDPMLYLPKI